MAVTATTIRETLKNPPQDPAAQKELYNAALELMMGLESAQDTAQRLYHGHVPLAMAQTATDLNLFNIVSHKPERNWTLDELAETTEADPVLLLRILKCMAAYGMICENDDATFKSSRITNNLAISGTDKGM